MSDYVRVEFDPPRYVSERGKALQFMADGKDDVFIPTAVCSVFQNADGCVEAIEIPEDVAIRKGLRYDDGGHSGSPKEAVVSDAMSRKDWFALGLAMAIVASGKNPNDEAVRRNAGDALWVACERVDQVFRERRGEWP